MFVRQGEETTIGLSVGKEVGQYYSSGDLEESGTNCALLDMTDDVINTYF